MSRARTFADLATASESNSLSNRNMIHNGNFAVHQKGGTITCAANSSTGTTLDRWEVDSAATDNISVEITQSDDVPAELGEGFSLKHQTKTVESALATNEIQRIIQYIEAQDCQRLGYGTSSPKRATVSFYVKSSIAGTFSFVIYQDDGADIIGSTYTINSADTWERKTITFPGNTLATIANDNGIGLYMQWTVFAGSDYTGGDNTTWKSYATNLLAHGHSQNGHATTDESTFQLAGCQFELGDVATPFEHIDYADNLAKCQRYFYKYISNDIYGPLGANGMQINTNSTAGTMFQGQHPVMMRTAPSMSYGGTWTGEVATGTITFALTGSVRVSNLFWQSQEPIPTSGANNGDAALVYANNDNDAYIIGNAEL